MLDSDCYVLDSDCYLLDSDCYLLISNRCLLVIIKDFKVFGYLKVSETLLTIH